MKKKWKEKSHKQYKHLTLKERAMINDGLNNGASIKTIAAMLGRNPTTITREIQRNFSIIEANFFNNEARNKCIHRRNCKITNLCQTCRFPRKDLCSKCILCNEKCPNYDSVCPKLKKSPYVCNGCEKYRYCREEKFVYDFENAQKYYNIIKSDSRKNPHIPNEYIVSINDDLKEHLERGLSINNYIAINNPPVSKSTIYRLIENGYFTFNKDDVIEKRKLKPKKTVGKPKPKHLMTGRAFIDYLCYLKENEFFETIQMDTVIGRSGGSVLLTIFFTRTQLLLAYVLPDRTMQSVEKAITSLKLSLQQTKISFNELCPVCLVDNGTEFNNPLIFELDEYGEYKSKVFYCDTWMSVQKAEIERAHRELRRLLPRGTSFNNLTQEQLNVILSHYNSYGIPKQGYASPYDSFNLAYGREVLDALNIKKIPPKDVVRNKKSILKFL